MNITAAALIDRAYRDPPDKRTHVWLTRAELLFVAEQSRGVRPIINGPVTDSLFLGRKVLLLDEPWRT